MKPEIREATEADIPFLAWVIFRAAQSHLDRCPLRAILEQDEGETRAFLENLSRTEPVHWGHFSRFLIAESDGVPVAGMSAYIPETQGNEVLAGALVQVAASNSGFPETRIDRIRTRLGIARSVFPDDASTRAWGIEGVAAVPEFRGSGVIDQLFEHALQKGREAGFGCAQILSLIGNAAAERTWKRNGFVTLEERSSPDFDALIGAPGVKRFVKPL